MKKMLLLSVSMILAIGILVGCAGTPATSGTPGAGTVAPGEQPAPGAQERIPIELWHYQVAITAEYLTEAIANYNARPESLVYVTLQYLPRNELIARYILGVVSGDLPEIGFADNPDSAALSAMGMWIDITDRVNAMGYEWLEGPINSGRFEGRQYTIPVRSNCLALWSNNEMMERAGVERLPETWDEFIDVLTQLRDALPGVDPLALSAQRTEESTFQFLPFLLSTGATWDNVDSPEGVRALTLFQTLIDNRLMSPEVINWVQNDVQKQFAAYNAAMMINGSWQIPNMARDNPNIEYTISLIPRDRYFATSLGGENAGMTIAARPIEDYVWDFMAWWHSAETSKWYNMVNGTISTNRSVTVEMKYGDDPIQAAFAQQIVYAVPRGPHIHWPELSNHIQEAIQAVLTGAATPEAAAAEAGARIAQINAGMLD